MKSLVSIEVKPADNSISAINENLVEDFINFCDVQPVTAKTYLKSLRAFYSFLQAQNVTNPTRESVIAFRNSLLSNGYKVTTCRLYLSVVKLFVRWLASRGMCANFADNVKSVKLEHVHNRDALTPAESRDVLRSFDGKTIKSARDKAIMSLMLVCGLRSVEVIRLDCGDIEKRRGEWFIKIHGKARAGKVDSVRLPVQVKGLIDSYLDFRGEYKDSSPLFAALSNRNKGERLDTQTISRMAKSAFRSVGIDSPRVTCHSARHSCATNMLIGGADIAQVQQILRHRNINTTQIYRHDLDVMTNSAADIVAGMVFDGVPRKRKTKT